MLGRMLGVEIENTDGTDEGLTDGILVGKEVGTSVGIVLGINVGATVHDEKNISNSNNLLLDSSFNKFNSTLSALGFSLIAI